VTFANAAMQQNAKIKLRTSGIYVVVFGVVSQFLGSYRRPQQKSVTPEAELQRKHEHRRQHRSCGRHAAVRSSTDSRSVMLPPQAHERGHLAVLEGRDPWAPVT